MAKAAWKTTDQVQSAESANPFSHLISSRYLALRANKVTLHGPRNQNAIFSSATPSYEILLLKVLSRELTQVNDPLSLSSFTKS